MKTIKLILKYVRYILIAKSKHAAQSPFLYELVTQVIKKKENSKILSNIKSLRKELNKCEKEIQITDFGAGSTINNSRKRRIKDIAMNSAKDAKFGELLFRIVKHYKPKTIIELGTSLGISTSYLSLASSKSKVFTFEGCKETAAIAKENFEKQKITNTSIILGDFNITLAEKLKVLKNIDLAFIDGNHTQDATIAYFEKCLEYANNETIFIFDDIYWSNGMENAWEYIKKHKQTRLTINLFFVGIVFIKSELSKEDYTIRF